MHIDTIDERLALFRRMMEQASLDPDNPATAPEGELRAAAQRCLGCRVGEECREWLESVPDTEPLPGFCRNVAQFQQWVAQEIARDLAGLSRRIEVLMDETGPAGA